MWQERGMVQLVLRCILHTIRGWEYLSRIALICLLYGEGFTYRMLYSLYFSLGQVMHLHQVMRMMMKKKMNLFRNNVNLLTS